MKFTYESYHAFSVNLEGRVATMYCDCLGLITTGVGNLINTITQAKALPWLLADGTKADMADVAADWNKLHDGAQYYAKRAWHVYAKTMRCHLSEEAIDDLCKRQLAANEAIIRKRFPAYDSFPADAQLAIMSMAWAVGAGFASKFPHLAACIDRQDWEGCVASCKIREGHPHTGDWNPGVVPRNAKNRFCFHNAALVATEGSDPDVLHWPNVAAFSGSIAEPKLLAAQKDAELKLAAWHALDVCPFTLPGAGRATLDDENS